MLEHGGKLLQASHRYGIAVQDWLDLSTGISPRGWPLPAIDEAAWRRLPQEEDGLQEAACRYYGARALLPVAGSQAAIQALPALRAPCRVGVMAPAYAEHAQGWARAGHRVSHRPAAALLDAAEAFDVIVLIHPANPGGEVFAVADLLALHARLAARGGWLVVDEAFIDATPTTSLCAFSDRPGLIVLRSVGKFFGLAGARVGFVAAEAALLHTLAEQLGPWTVNGPARQLVRQALQDVRWQAEQRRWLAEQSAALGAVLGRHGIMPTAATAFFHYWRDARADQVHEALCRRGILTRRFADPAALRFGLPADEAGLCRLAAALSEIR